MNKTPFIIASIVLTMLTGCTHNSELNRKLIYPTHGHADKDFFTKFDKYFLDKDEKLLKAAFFGSKNVKSKPYRPSATTQFIFFDYYLLTSDESDCDLMVGVSVDDRTVGWIDSLRVSSNQHKYKCKIPADLMEIYIQNGADNQTLEQISYNTDQYFLSGKKIINYKKSDPEYQAKLKQQVEKLKYERNSCAKSGFSSPDCHQYLRDLKEYCDIVESQGLSENFCNDLKLRIENNGTKPYEPYSEKIL